jgi:hypothetical protein
MNVFAMVRQWVTRTSYFPAVWLMPLKIFQKCIIFSNSAQDRVPVLSAVRGFTPRGEEVPAVFAFAK